MAQNILIRPPRQNEYESWSSVYKTYLDFYQTSLTPTELERVWSWLFESPQQLHAYVAEIDKSVVGLAHFRIFRRPIKACSGIYLDDLVVLPEYRGRGIGCQLIETIKIYAKDNGLSIVRWITAADNKAARHLYDAVGHQTNWITYEIKM
jgi:ribosomal protein S18 acetylase RimI-like enzyme